MRFAAQAVPVGFCCVGFADAMIRLPGMPVESDRIFSADAAARGSSRPRLLLAQLMMRNGACAEAAERGGGD